MPETHEQQQFTIGNQVRVREKDSKRGWTTAKVTGNNGHGLLALEFAPVPLWLRVLFQRRGVFLGSKAVCHLRLFRDFTGDWTDTETMTHYEVTDK